MTLGILTALWRRPAVSRLVLGYYAGVDAVRVAVRSPEDPEPVEVEGWVYVDAPNTPLSDKWNAGLKALDADAVMITGSDDMVSRALIAKSMELISEGVDLVLFDTLHAVQAETGEMVRLRPARMGAGRMISRRLLDRAEWRLWPKGLNRHLDGGMDRRLREVEGRGRKRRRYRSKLIRAFPGAAILDIKSNRDDGTSANLWTMTDLKRWKAEAVSAEEKASILNLFPICHGEEK